MKKCFYCQSAQLIYLKTIEVSKGINADLYVCPRCFKFDLILSDNSKKALIKKLAKREEKKVKKAIKKESN